MQFGQCNLTLPAPSHIGIVVKDINKAVEFFSQKWGVEFGDIEDVLTPKDDIIIGESYGVKLTSANLGPLEIHVMEPLDNKSIYGKWLKAHGEGGLHHLAFTVPNWDEMASHMQNSGAKMIGAFIYRGSFEEDAKEKGVRCGYFETPGGIVIEFVEIFES